MPKSVSNSYDLCIAKQPAPDCAPTWTANATNLRYGCPILSYYLKRENGDLRRALARYNGSLGKDHYPARVIGFWQDFWYVRP